MEVCGIFYKYYNISILLSDIIHKYGKFYTYKDRPTIHEKDAEIKTILIL